MTIASALILVWTKLISVEPILILKKKVEGVSVVTNVLKI